MTRPLDHLVVGHRDHAEEAEEARRLLLRRQPHELADGVLGHLRAHRPVVLETSVDAPRRRDVVRDEVGLRVVDEEGDRRDELGLHQREVGAHRLEQTVRGAEDGADLELVGLDLALLEGKVGEEGERRRVRLQVHQQHLHVLVGA